MDTAYLSYKTLNRVMAMSKVIRERYSEGLRLITDSGMKPESAFTKSGFAELFERAKKRTFLSLLHASTCLIEGYS